MSATGISDNHVIIPLDTFQVLILILFNDDWYEIAIVIRK